MAKKQNPKPNGETTEQSDAVEQPSQIVPEVKHSDTPALRHEPIVQSGRVGVFIHSEIESLYEVSEGDISNFPELNNQGISAGDKVSYGSLWVLKSLFASAPRNTRVPWPLSIHSINH